MTSIPADPTLVLGMIIQPEKIDQLMQIADLQKPVNNANDRLNNLIASDYKLQMIYNQMVNLNVDLESLEKLDDEKLRLKAETAKAAIDYAEEVIKSEAAVREAKDKMSQMQISRQIESPIDFKQSKIEQFPLSFDSLKFDVQFFQSLDSDDSSTAHAQSISKHISVAFSAAIIPSVSADLVNSAHESVAKQTSSSRLEGTIVITANATHKQADLMAPCVMDPVKLLTAWNFTYQDDYLGVDPEQMMNSALKRETSEDRDRVLHILTGVSRGSAFVGYVHILKDERTNTTSRATSTASAVKGTVEANMFAMSLTGSYSMSKDASASMNSLLSTSMLNNQASLTCMGVIPSIVSNSMETAVQNLSPDPQQIMSQLTAIQGASDAGVNQSMEAQASDAKTGAQFIALNSEYLKTSVAALGDETRISNKVIDTNSMMTAFEDYLKKAIEGNCGIPINYFIKEVSKSMVARTYVKKFYPNGARTQRDAMAGTIGQDPDDAAQST
mmetsp:Transcript_12868/g.18905  ORF Transcript_12868/g.18905 Transcript_12868/m.18905 type:complete len:500 (+) Transcript_12868:166-1665(+)